MESLKLGTLTTLLLHNASFDGERENCKPPTLNRRRRSNTRPLSSPSSTLGAVLESLPPLPHPSAIMDIILQLGGAPTYQQHLVGGSGLNRRLTLRYCVCQRPTRHVYSFMIGLLTALLTSNPFVKQISIAINSSF
jgi:hypothetical protein